MRSREIVGSWAVTCGLVLTASAWMGYALGDFGQGLIAGWVIVAGLGIPALVLGLLANRRLRG